MMLAYRLSISPKDAIFSKFKLVSFDFKIRRSGLLRLGDDIAPVSLVFSHPTRTDEKNMT